MRPDGGTLISLIRGKALAWDATIAFSLADSYLGVSSSQAGSVSVSAASRKISKYADLPSEFSFQPIALESLGPASASMSVFLVDLGSRISDSFGESQKV